MDPQLSSSSELSKLVILPRIDEQALESIKLRSGHGIFIGNTRRYSLPFFLSFGDLMNPHIFITGITGSGKTYLAKSLMLKLYAILECIVIVIDFTGEYAELARLFSNGSSPTGEVEKRIEEGAECITYINLSKLEEQEKVDAAVGVLDIVARKMRRRGYREGNRRIFVVLDEAWKLIGRGGPLEVMIREGRKYGVGMVIASQLVGDIDAPFLSNMATVFVFRVQDKQSLEVLSKNYCLRPGQSDAIQNLEVGSCFVVQLNRSNIRDSFQISRVIGVRMRDLIRILMGEDMNVEITSEEFDGMVRRLCDDGHRREISTRAKEQGYLRLDGLVRDLILAGADRRKILKSLKEIGIDESDIADAFSSAVKGLGSLNE
jgi:hypothetical protein